MLRRDGKAVLMDFYYDEAQMNKWRDSCVRGQESLRQKVERFENAISLVRQKYGNAQIQVRISDETNIK